MARCNACRRFGRCATSSLCRPVLQVHITMDSSGSVVAVAECLKWVHFGTNRDAYHCVYWSHPLTGADVLALGKQGRRVRLAHLFDAAPAIIVHFGTITLSSRRSPSRYRLLLRTSVVIGDTHLLRDARLVTVVVVVTAVAIVTAALPRTAPPLYPKSRDAHPGF